MNGFCVPDADSLVPKGDIAMNDVLMLEPQADEGAISFARGFVKSDAFMLLFREGMGLVEHTASYLDTDGRAESAALPREVVTGGPLNSHCG